MSTLAFLKMHYQKSFWGRLVFLTFFSVGIFSCSSYSASATNTLSANAVANQTEDRDLTVVDSGSVPAVNQAVAANTESTNTCFPPCRSGFLCHNGTCISACNPPCEAGYVCNGEGECVAEAGFAIGDDEGYKEEVSEPEDESDDSDDAEMKEEELKARKYKGFFLETQPIGLGFCQSSIKYNGGTTVVSSPSFTPFGFLIGGAPLENLTLYVAMRITAPIGADRKVLLNVDKYKIYDSLFILYGFFGGGVRYNLPLQFFVGVEGGKMLGPEYSNDYDDEKDNDQFYAIQDSSTSYSGKAWYVRFEAGKEWWMGSKWTIGVGMNVDIGESVMEDNTYYGQVYPYPYVNVHSFARNVLIGFNLRLGRH